MLRLFYPKSKIVLYEMNVVMMWSRLLSFGERCGFLWCWSGFGVIRLIWILDGEMCNLKFNVYLFNGLKLLLKGKTFFCRLKVLVYVLCSFIVKYDLMTIHHSVPEVCCWASAGPAQPEGNQKETSTINIWGETQFGVSSVSIQSVQGSYFIHV